MMDNELDRVYQYIFDNSEEPVIIFEKDGRVLLSNPIMKQELGYDETQEEVTVRDIFPNSLSELLGKFTFSKETQNHFSEEAFVYRKNRTCYPARVKLTWLNLINRSIGILYIKNLSELKQSMQRERSISEELEDALSIKNTFLANVTHELRTPVNGIKGLAEVLLDSGLTNQQTEHVKIIHRCCDNMSHIINEILDYAKISAGKLELCMQEFDFREFMNNTLAVHQSQLNEKGLQALINISKEVPEKLIGDELRLGQILNNLISNAIKFTSIGEIAIEVMNTYQDEKEIELFFMIMDSGIGIAKEDMDKLFLSFSQVDGIITRKFGGTGLGLSITKALVEIMNGTIHVSSEKGKGSTFSFSIRFQKSSQVSKGEENVKQEDTDSATQGIEEYSNTVNINLHPDNQERSMVKSSMNSYLQKLAISLELGNWEKAEHFAATIKSLLINHDDDIKKQAFRVEMAVRKEDYEKSLDQIRILIQMMGE